MTKLDRSIAIALATATLATAHADTPPLGALEQRIRSGELPQVHSVIVEQRGKRLAEWYFAGHDEEILHPPRDVTFDANTLHDIRSVTKCVVSLLFGIAQHEGAIKSLETPVFDYFPEYAALRTPQKEKILLKHILSMTSGLHWDERTYPYSDPRNSEIAMDIAEEPDRYVLSQPLDHEPGAQWQYSGGDVALVGTIISRAVNRPLADYADEKLFKPLGIQWTWSMNRGIPRAASGLRLTPNGMMKLGQLVLHKGSAEDKQIVPADWIEQATTRHADVEPDPKCGTGYGYLFWLNPGCQFTPPTALVVGNGNGGQRIWVVRSRDLVIVSTAGWYNAPDQGEKANRLLQMILGAL